MQARFGIQGMVTISEVYGNPVRPLAPHALALAYARGDARKVLKTHNHLTDIGLEVITACIAGGFGLPLVGGSPVSPATIGDAFLHHMRITAEPSPTAPTDLDTALEGTTVFEGDVDALTLIVTYPALGKVNFGLLMPQLTLPGTTLTEEGLFTNDNKLAARTTFSKLKTSSFALQFDHEFEFSRI